MHVVVIGGGFGGVSAVLNLSKIDSLKITLIDRRNFHLFQPLLYQVAMAGLNPSDISIPLRTLFRNKSNVSIILSEVTDINLSDRLVEHTSGITSYDYLVLATGVKHSYFGNDEWEEYAPGLKNIEQAIEIRRRIFLAIENAENEVDPDKRKELLRFVVVGGGPTGVELAGSISEIISHTIVKDFKNCSSKEASVYLVEAGDRLLSAYPERLSLKTKQYLEKMGVRVFLNSFASDLQKNGLSIGGEYISAKTIIWAAGVTSSSLSNVLDVEKDKFGRLVVEKDLSLKSYDSVFCIGDQAALVQENGNYLPGIAPVAIQQGKHVSRIIRNDLRNKKRPDFKYKDRGMMATIGRSKAVAVVYGIPVSGFIAWLLWVFVHIAFIARLRNRFFIFFQWVWSYFAFGYGARLITHKTWRFYSGEKISLDL